jgi:hypothetical protein
LVAAAVVTVSVGVYSAQAPRFYADDPIARVPESQDASKAAIYNIDQIYEMLNNLFVVPKHTPSGTRAQNINTIDEVPDSSWFTNRIGAGPISNADLTRGPNVGAAPDPSKWTLIREKTAGSHPGFTAVGIPASVRRFGLLACYDMVREPRLPPALRNKNPNGHMWRCIDGAWTQRDV